MFSGIIEARSHVKSARSGDQTVEIQVLRPPHFNDLAIGDSVAVDGVCLTVEKLESDLIQFTLAAETLQVTGWNEKNITGKELNLERSLKLGERLHGHFVYGHVDGLADVTEAFYQGDSFWMKLRFPAQLKPFIWPKGSVALNGVSLTINQVEDLSFNVCLVPETIRQTNLAKLTTGDSVNIEVDALARALVHNAVTGAGNA